MLSELEHSVLAHIDDAQLIDWVQQLTRIPSVWKPELGTGEAAAAQWVADRCKEIGLHTVIEDVVPGRPNVIAVHTDIKGFALDEIRGGAPGKRRLLMFEGHTDVVTEGDPAKWTDPPFSATIRNGRIYGRGANDMKAGVCCALMAVKALAASGVALAGDIVLGIVCDEEGRMLGIKNFVERGWADQVSACIVCEPEENHLCITQKGVMWLKVVIHGVMSHGAMPLTGVNTAYPMAQFLLAAQALEAREIKRMAHAARIASDPAQREIIEFLGYPSITPTVLLSPMRGAGEPQNNVMPASTEVTLDVRLIPGQDPDWLAAQLKTMAEAACASDSRLQAEVEVIELRHPTLTDRNHDIVRTLGGAYTDLHAGRAPIFGGVPGSTDGTILNARKGIPIVTCGPGDIYIPHHIDEWVSIDEIKQAARMYALAALRFLNN